MLQVSWNYLVCSLRNYHLKVTMSRPMLDHGSKMRPLRSQGVKYKNGVSWHIVIWCYFIIFGPMRHFDGLLRPKIFVGSCLLYLFNQLTAMCPENFRAAKIGHKIMCSAPRHLKFGKFVEIWLVKSSKKFQLDSSTRNGLKMTLKSKISNFWKTDYQK